MIWTLATLAVLLVLLIGAVHWVYTVFFKDPDGPKALIRLLKKDAASPSFGFWVWWAGSSRLADITLPLSAPLPLSTAFRGSCIEQPRQEETKKQGESEKQGEMKRQPHEARTPYEILIPYEVISPWESEVRKELTGESTGELTKELDDALREASKTVGPGLRVAGAGVRATFQVHDSGDPRMWKALHALDRIRKLLNQKPLSPRGAEKHWSGKGAALTRGWVAEAVDVADKLKPLWQRAARPQEVGLQRLAFSVQLRPVDRGKGVSLNLEAPLVPGPPKGLRLYAKPEAVYALPKAKRRELDEEALFRELFVVEGPKSDLVSWWATGEIRRALVKGWEMLGGGLEVSAQGVVSGVTLSTDPETQAVVEHIQAFHQLVKSLSR